MDTSTADLKQTSMRYIIQRTLSIISVRVARDYEKIIFNPKVSGNKRRFQSLTAHSQYTKFKESEFTSSQNDNCSH